MKTRTLSVLDVATRYVVGGLSVVPILADGSKKPTIAWKEYQRRPPTAAELRSWFAGGGLGLAVICGRVSRGLEVMDFDEPGLFEQWQEVVEQQAPGLLARLPIVATPRGGRHVYYRLPKPLGNQKLAQRPPTPAELEANAKAQAVTLIETRGEGGYVLAPGCPGACHETGGEYRLLGNTEITDAPLLPEVAF